MKVVIFLLFIISVMFEPSSSNCISVRTSKLSDTFIGSIPYSGSSNLKSIWIKPGRFFISIKFSLVIDSQFDFKSEKEHTDYLVINSPAINEAQWSHITYRIDKTKRTFSRDRYTLTATLNGLSEFEKTIYLWSSLTSIKGTKIYVSGGSEIAFDCKPIETTTTTTSTTTPTTTTPTTTTSTTTPTTTTPTTTTFTTTTTISTATLTTTTTTSTTTPTTTISTTTPTTTISSTTPTLTTTTSTTTPTTTISTTTPTTTTPTTTNSTTTPTTTISITTPTMTTTTAPTLTMDLTTSSTITSTSSPNTENSFTSSSTPLSDMITGSLRTAVSSTTAAPLTAIIPEEMPTSHTLVSLTTMAEIEINTIEISNMTSKYTIPMETILYASKISVNANEQSKPASVLSPSTENYDSMAFTFISNSTGVPNSKNATPVLSEFSTENSIPRKVENSYHFILISLIPTLTILCGSLVLTFICIIRHCKRKNKQKILQKSKPNQPNVELQPNVKLQPNVELLVRKSLSSNYEKYSRKINSEDVKTLYVEKQISKKRSKPKPEGLLMSERTLATVENNYEEIKSPEPQKPTAPNVKETPQSLKSKKILED